MAQARAISHLRSGQEAQFNQIILRCEPGRAVTTFGETGDTDGRGLLVASYADCQFANGTSVRIKGGYKTPPSGFGVCGSDPGKILSVWVGARKLVSAETYVPYCSELILKSTVTADRAVICQLSQSEDAQRDFERRYSTLPERGVCRTYRLGPASAKDVAEFPPNGREPNIGWLSTVRPASERAFCQRFIAANDPTMVAVPAGIRHPNWTALPPDPSPPDVGNVGFNATTFSFDSAALAGASTKAAQFDLENDGRVTTVYQHDEERGWFDGSAFARERSGILTTPFDAHDWDRSAKDGIYPFVYDQATEFFDQGRTYILLDPANGDDDPRIVTIANGQAQTFCTLQRLRENF